MKKTILNLIMECLNEDNDSLPIIKKLGSIKTDEGKFSAYDISNDIRHRGTMFTVFEDKNGWIVRNSFVPEELQRKGIATNFYIKMNELSKQKTGKPLRSTVNNYIII